MSENTKENTKTRKFNLKKFIPSWKTIGATLVGLFILGIIGFPVWFGLWVTIIDNYEVGYVFDKVTGEISIIEKKGWIVRTPIRYKVHTIDLRPYQITITASMDIGQRVLNAKLVKFNPDGLQEFVKWHGRGAGNTISKLKEIMKCYAFAKEDGKNCPFITVVQEITPTQDVTTPESPVDMGSVEK